MAEGGAGMGHSREEWEDLWRRRLETATEAQRRAAAEVKRIIESKGSGALSGPDGEFALQQALRVEGRTRADFVRVLRIFTDLILRRSKPPDDTELSS